MCYLSFRMGQFKILKTQSERHAIELLFKVQVSPDHPTSKHKGVRALRGFFGPPMRPKNEKCFLQVPFY